MLYHIILDKAVPLAKCLNLYKQYHAENKIYLVHFCRYILNLVLLLIFGFLDSLFLVNGPQAR